MKKAIILFSIIMINITYSRITVAEKTSIFSEEGEEQAVEWYNNLTVEAEEVGRDPSILKARAAQKNKKYLEAISYYKEWIDRNPRSYITLVTYKKVANWYRYLGDNDKANSELRLGISAAKEMLENKLCWEGAIYGIIREMYINVDNLSDNEFKEGLKYFRDYMKFYNITGWDGKYKMAEYLGNNGKHEEAINWYNKTREALIALESYNPEGKKLWLSNVEIGLAEIYSKQNESVKAILSIRNATKNRHIALEDLIGILKNINDEGMIKILEEIDKESTYISDCIGKYIKEHPGVLDSLDTLAKTNYCNIPFDPFNPGKYYQYQALEPGWVLWSIGPDLKDGKAINAYSIENGVLSSGDIIYYGNSNNEVSQLYSDANFLIQGSRKAIQEKKIESARMTIMFAQNLLEKVKKDNPDWNPQDVQMSIGECVKIIDLIEEERGREGKEKRASIQKPISEEIKKVLTEDFQKTSLLIQEARRELQDKKYNSARGKAKKAHNILLDINRKYPSWNSEAVKQSKEECRKIFYWNADSGQTGAGKNNQATSLTAGEREETRSSGKDKAEVPSEQYNEAYHLIREASKAIYEKNLDQARTSIKSAQAILRDIKDKSPDWNSSAVEARLNECDNLLNTSVRPE